MEIDKVGVAGCGLMGSGITQVCAQSGLRVTVLEANGDLLEKGLQSIGRVMARGIEKGKISEEQRDAAMSRISGTTEIADLAGSELVIEAVTEKMELKRKLFAELDEICPAHTIFATNTSALSVIDIGTATRRLDKVLGIHFFNPVPVMKLVEIVRTLATSDESVETAKAFCNSIGKTAVLTKDTPGFIVNRLSIGFALIAVRMLESGIAAREDIDSAVTLGLNHPMGPLALADFLGVDTLYYAAADMYEKTRDPLYAPPVLLQKMIAAGWYGRKSGRGFYEYS